MNRGSVGTINLNHQMQQLINPAIENQQSIHRFGIEYRLNDRVMQIRNNYDKFVFNGDIGQITLINISDQEISVTFGDREIIYDYSELNELVLAYALSIHKSQGSRISRGYHSTVHPALSFTPKKSFIHRRHPRTKTLYLSRTTARNCHGSQK